MLISKRLLIYLLLSLIFLTGVTYYHRNPSGDDAWLAEQSYWLVKDGVIRSEFFNGLLQWNKQLFVSHKLYVAFGALVISIFGNDILTFQCIGLLFFISILIGLLAYCKKREGSYLTYSTLFILVLVFSNRFLIRISFENRPELMVTALGFASFLCLLVHRKTTCCAALAGFFAGLSMLCHLNGVIYLCAGFGLLAATRRYKALLVFSCVGLLTGLAYFTDIILAKEGFSTWLVQFRNDPATRNAFGFTARLMVMLTYPRLFFYTPEHAALSLLFVFIVWNQRNLLKQLPSSLAYYSAFLVGSFWLITKHPSGTYLALFIPFMLLIIYELYKVKPFNNLALKIVLFVYFFIGIYGTLELIYKNNTGAYLPAAYHELRPSLSTAHRGLVPLPFFFNEYENYSQLTAHDNYSFFAKDKSEPSHKMAIWANNRNLDFILLDYKNSPAPHYPAPGTTHLPFYKLAHFDGQFAVYKHN